MQQPTHVYLDHRDAIAATRAEGGSASIVEADGMAGLLADRRGTRVPIPRHTVAGDRGSLTFWMYSLDDLASATSQGWMHEWAPDHEFHTLLSDSPKLREWKASNFSVTWDSRWYPQFYARFYRGNIYHDAYKPVEVRRGLVFASHFNIQRHQWYQVALTWDKPSSRIKLFVNGVLVGTAAPIEHNPLVFEDVADTLYLGHTSIALGNLKFYDAELSESEVTACFDAEVPRRDETLQQHLRHVYAGEGNPRFDVERDEGWELKLDLPLTKPDTIDEHFRVQGFSQTTQPRVTDEGIHVETLRERPRGSGDQGVVEKVTPDALPEAIAPQDSIRPGELMDLAQGYLHSRARFEGDIWIEYDFKPLRETGLSLLMVNVTGVQREDIFLDDPPRHNGSMRMVAWENVRNYHWEYYRQVMDVRTDIASHVVIKNPWNVPLALGHQAQRLAINEWHKLTYVQRGGHILAAVDGEVVVNVTDTPWQCHGPLNTSGNLSIRCMIDTSMLFRNLRVYNRPPPFERTPAGNS